MNIVALLETLVKGLLEAEEKFLSNPKDFYSLETAVKASTDAVAAGFLENILSSVNKQIYDSSWRKGKYTVARNDKRTLISSVGDIVFDCTYYRKCEDGSFHYLLEELMHLGKHERLTEAAESMILTEALKTSYEEASKVLPSKQKITKTTVMQKVHQIAENLPVEELDEKKNIKTLFIEADEDHVSEQHGRWIPSKDNKSFISRLIYIYEYKQEVPNVKGKKELVNTHYFSGLYEGTEGIEKMWNEVNDFIEATYGTDVLERVYISGDGAAWIKAGAKYIPHALFCADKFHLMKYINSASNQMLDESEWVKSEIYRLLNKRDKEGFEKLTSRMQESASNEKYVTDLRAYVLGNWKAVIRTLRNKEVDGCSAESHVSHVLSDRLSSRPKGWSKLGADRMSRLRCYEKNYGREKIIDLVKYSREQRELQRTGTEDIPVKAMRIYDVWQDHSDKAKGYIERMQATIPGFTAKKIAAIRNGLSGL